MTESNNRRGAYTTGIFVEQSKLDEAWNLACDYDMAVAQRRQTSNFIAGKLQDRRLHSMERKLCSLTRQEFIGNVEQAEADIQSGLLEMYSPYTDRDLLANIIASRLITADVVVTEDVIPW